MRIRAIERARKTKHLAAEETANKLKKQSTSAAVAHLLAHFWRASQRLFRFGPCLCVCVRVCLCIHMHARAFALDAECAYEDEWGRAMPSKTTG